MADAKQPTIPTTYDSLFKKYGQPDIPVAYLRALALMESNFNPQCENSPSAGLMQISKIALKDFNQLNSTKITEKDRFDPKTSVRIGTWLIRRIIKQYKAKAPGLLEPKWDDPRFVSLLTLGWTAGWAGTAKIVAQMRSKIPDNKIDLDSVIQVAGKSEPKSRIYSVPSPGPYMSDPKLRAWVLKVVQKYFNELGQDPLQPGKEIPVTDDSSVPLPGKLIVGVAALGVAGYAIWQAMQHSTPTGPGSRNQLPRNGQTITERFKLPAGMSKKAADFLQSLGAKKA